MLKKTKKTVLDEALQQYPNKPSQGKPEQVQKKLTALALN